MNKLLIFFVILFIGQSMLAQRDRAHSLNIGKHYTGEAINVFDLRTKNTPSSLYWFEEWTPGIVKLKNGQTFNQYLLRFDVMGEGLELNLMQDVKLLPGFFVTEFFLQLEDETHHFVNPQNYFQHKDFVPGFYELIYEGKISLLQKAEVKILKANYVTALDAGDKNDKAVRTDVFFLFDGKEVYEIPRQKKKALSRLSSIHPELEKYLKDQKLNPKKRADLIKLVQEVGP